MEHYNNERFWRMFSWSVSKEDIENQVRHYDTLRFLYTFRGFAISIMFFIYLVLYVLIAILVVTEPSFRYTYIDWVVKEGLLNLFVYAFFMYNIYVGQKWSVILFPVLYILLQTYYILVVAEEILRVVASLIGILMVAAYFRKAWIIEKGRGTKRVSLA